MEEENIEVSDSINSVVEIGNKTSPKPCNVSEEVFKDLDSFPPGWRFTPSDEELITQYLLNKVEGREVPKNKIVEVNIYKYHPLNLIAEYRKYGDNENQWYFFTPRKKKYRNGSRPNRAACGGYWKATGAHKSIKDGNEKTIGWKKALVFYTGKAPAGDKTNWIMHEFTTTSDDDVRVRTNGNDDNPDAGMKLDDWVLCRIYDKNEKNERSTMRNPSNKISRSCKNPYDRISRSKDNVIEQEEAKAKGDRKEDFHKRVSENIDQDTHSGLVLDDSFGLFNEFSLLNYPNCANNQLVDHNLGISRYCQPVFPASLPSQQAPYTYIPPQSTFTYTNFNYINWLLYQDDAHISNGEVLPSSNDNLLTEEKKYFGPS